MKRVSLEFVEGNSSKFWDITQTGRQLKVHFGRIGTAGQEKETELDSSQEALTSLEKQVKEKLKKGYKLIKELEADEPAEVVEPAKSTATVANSVAAGSATRPAVHNSQVSPAPMPVLEETARTRAVELTIDEVGFAFSLRKEPFTRPGSLPFDQPKARERVLENVLSASHAATLSCATWTKEECVYWVLGMTLCGKMAFARPHDYLWSGTFRTDARALLNELPSKVDLSQTPAIDDVVQAFSQVGLRSHPNHLNGYHETYSCLAPVLLQLYSLDQFIEIWEKIWVTTGDPHISADFATHIQGMILAAVRVDCLPFINDVELKHIRDYLRQRISQYKWSPTKTSDVIPVPYLVAGLLGMRDELLPVVKEIPDGFYAQESAYSDLARPQVLVLGLVEPDLIDFHWHRLKLKISKQGEFFSWVALQNWQNLDPACRYLEEQNTFYQFYAPGIIDLRELRFLLRANTPGVARAAVRLLPTRHYGKVCREWIEKNDMPTLIALLTADLDDSESGIRCKRYLADLTRRISINEVPPEYRELFEKIQEAEPSGSEQMPGWLAELFDKHARKFRGSVPTYLKKVSFSPIVIEGYMLSDSQLEFILNCMKASTPDKVDPFLVELREKVDRRTFDAFVWDVFGRWTDNHAPSGDKFCIFAIGYLGSDEQIVRLIPYMKNWRANGNAARAGYGLDSFRASGTDLALSKVHEISQSTSLKSLRNKAVKDIQLIAKTRNLTPEALADRMIPDCGLDKDGQKVFDFGNRKFRFVLGKDLKPYLKDGDGKVRNDLPQANQSDDAEKAAEAERQWKNLKTQLRSVVKVQTRRLEESMITSRSWSQSEFGQFVRHHPLIRHFARHLIFGEVDKNGNLLSTFRVTEEDELADENDKPKSLVADSSIIIVHSYQLDKSLLEKWGEIAADYDLVPPFVQLGRTVMRASEEEIRSGYPSRFAELKIEAVTLVGGLDKKDWTREPVGDGPTFLGHYKYFAGRDCTAHITYTGVCPGMLTDSPEQEIESLNFYKYRVQANSWMPGSPLVIPYNEVDPIVMSEVLTDLSAIMSKAK